MAIIICTNKLSKKDFQRAKEDYKNYIKITTDVENKLVALGGEYHADAEKSLLEKGCLQKNIWGGGVNLETNQFESNALINLRPGQNDSTEILDPTIRTKFLAIAKKALEDYVK